MPIKYYHASRKLNWKPGDIIYPRERDCGFCVMRGIWLTTRREPHYTLYAMPKGRSIGECRYNLYRVIPHGKVVPGMWEDLVCTGHVEVVECLGEVAKSSRMSSIPRRNLWGIVFKSNKEKS